MKISRLCRKTCHPQSSSAIHITAFESASHDKHFKDVIVQIFLITILILFKGHRHEIAVSVGWVHRCI